MQRGAGAKLKCSMDWSKPKRVEPNKALEHWEMMGGWEGFSFTHLSVFPKMHLRIQVPKPKPAGPARLCHGRGLLSSDVGATQRPE